MGSTLANICKPIAIRVEQALKSIVADTQTFIVIAPISTNNRSIFYRRFNETAYSWSQDGRSTRWIDEPQATERPTMAPQFAVNCVQGFAHLLSSGLAGGRLNAPRLTAAPNDFTFNKARNSNRLVFLCGFQRLLLT